MKIWIDEITDGGTQYPSQIDFNTYDGYAHLFANTNSSYNNLGLKFDKKLIPEALLEIIKASDCNN